MPGHDREREFFARCAGGFEEVLAAELAALHCAQVKPVRGGASFAGTYADGLRVCLWSRVSTRVLLKLAHASAHSAQTLYAGARKVPWEKLIAPGATIAMHASGRNAALRNTQFTALRVKDAICDALLERTGARPDVDTAAPDVLVNVVVAGDKATISIDLAGESAGGPAAG